MILRKLKEIMSTEAAQAVIIILAVISTSYLIAPLLGRSQNPIYQKSGLTTVTQPGYLSGQNTIDPNDAFTSQTLGKVSAKQILSGNMPYWNHYEGVGSPLAGGMQGASLFPPVVLLIFRDGLLYFHLILQVIAGFAAYLFLKKIKISHWVAVTGGALFALNGTFAWLTNAPFNPVAFLPLLMLGIEHALNAAQKKQRSGGWILIAVALSLSLYSGFPETAFLSAIFAYGWGLVRLFQIDKQARKSYIVKILIGSVVGLLLAAPILVPFLGYLPYATTGGHEGGGFANIGLPITTLPALLLPYVFGPIFGLVKNGQPADLAFFWGSVGGYLTVSLLLVSVFSIFSKRNISTKIYLLAFIAIVVLKIYAFKPVSILINLIPGMDLIAFYRYSVPILSMALIILGMFGLEAIAKKQLSKKRALTSGLIVVVITGLSLLLGRPLLQQLQADFSLKWAFLSVVWAALVTVAILAVVLYNNKKITVFVVASLLLVDAFAMFCVPLLSIPKTTPVNYGPVTFLQQNLGQQRFYTLFPIQPNYGSYFEIASININNLPVPRNWSDYVEENLDSNVDSILFTGFSRHDPDGPTSLEEFARNQENYKAIGVKFLVTQEGAVRSEFADQQNLEKVYDDEQVEIYRLANTKPYFEAAGCTVNTSNRDTADIDCSRASTLTRRELFMPGWTAKVADQRSNISASEEIFQSLAVPAGKSKVQFIYNPPYIALAYAAFTIGLAAVVASLWRRRRSSDEQ